MEAGRELDILIVEKIFNRIPCDRREHFRVGELIKKCNHKECYPRNSPSDYSTHIGAAWKVVEKYTDVEIEKSGMNYSCIIVQGGFERITRQSLPLAICLAALKAEGITIPEVALD